MAKISRSEAARFIEAQLAPGYVGRLEKGLNVFYGLQELRELLDAIYGPPTCDEEKLRRLK